MSYDIILTITSTKLLRTYPSAHTKSPSIKGLVRAFSIRYFISQMEDVLVPPSSWTQGRIYHDKQYVSVASDCLYLIRSIYPGLHMYFLSTFEAIIAVIRDCVSLSRFYHLHIWLLLFKNRYIWVTSPRPTSWKKFPTYCYKCDTMYFTEKLRTLIFMMTGYRKWSHYDKQLLHISII